MRMAGLGNKNSRMAGKGEGKQEAADKKKIPRAKYPDDSEHRIISGIPEGWSHPCFIAP